MLSFPGDPESDLDDLLDLCLRPGGWFLLVVVLCHSVENEVILPRLVQLPQLVLNTKNLRWIRPTGDGENSSVVPSQRTEKPLKLIPLTECRETFKVDPSYREWSNL